MLLIRQRVANWVSRLRPVAQSQLATEAICCAAGAAEDSWQPVLIPIPTIPSPEPKTCNAGCENASLTFGQRLWGETQKAILMVVKFMTLAYLLEALIMLYIPEQWITSLLGNDNPAAIIIAAVLGVPVFTSNLAALPMIGGLLSQGMNPAAALAFLISGPTTTLPAMAAVWGIASRRVFALYVSFALLGAVVAGYLFNWVVGA